MVQLLTITCMLLVLSDKGKGLQSSSEQPLVGQEHCVTTLIAAAKENTFEVVFFTNSNFPLCKSKHVKQLNIRSNMSKSRSSASSRLQNTKKRMKAER